ncbi:DUF3618 domain-containing protein [Streptomyces zhihengii]|uniref:DUF3618 domain-containing protein n=1 Tax=Streptomyces zhihengii TaxID=1818004 RepID=A0ABS2V340_9ACTN|nr:DUF3618 domain-containing protein [Streptomyces zhihengii]MBM9623882.1 DUF3618 domain-containing protein [Streptomyces zhihengii]
MTHDSNSNGTSRSSEAPGPDELREQVQGTREELGITLEALAGKADVKTQAQEKADAAKARARDVAHDAQDRAAGLLHAAHDRTPEPVRQHAAQAGAAARQHQGLLIAGAAALALAVLLSRRWRK